MLSAPGSSILIYCGEGPALDEGFPAAAQSTALRAPCPMSAAGCAAGGAAGCPGLSCRAGPCCAPGLCAPLSQLN